MISEEAASKGWPGSPQGARWGHFDCVFFLSLAPISTHLLLTLASKEAQLREHVPRSLTEDPVLLPVAVPT